MSHTICLQAAERPRGRPPKYLTDEQRREGANDRARRYRARKKAIAMARRNSAVPLSSNIIDLSVLPRWRRGS